MLLLTSLFLSNPVIAGSLDYIEVAGPWGSPTSVNAAAAWWNPASLGPTDSHQIMLEVAPTRATMQLDRADPNGGMDTYNLFGVVPFLGFALNPDVQGLGIGGAVAVPMARGGAEAVQPGSGRYHMREGDVRALHGVLAVAYEVKNIASFGASFHVVQSQWAAVSDLDSLPDLKHAIEEFGEETDYTDDDLEKDPYAATLDFGTLHDTAFTFGLGTRIQPHRRLAIGISYIHGYHVDNHGEMKVDFGCPISKDDPTGALGAEKFGLCNTSVNANAQISYNLPSRIYVGVMTEPIDALRLELMGGWVGWSTFQDFDIQISGVSELNQFEDEAQATQTASLVEQNRKWARDAHDSFFAGLDIKGKAGERWILGARALYDASAIPNHALSTNNYDANTWFFTGLVAFKPIPKLSFGLSMSQAMVQTRTVTDSAFAVTLDDDARVEDRYFYPQMNGTYSANIQRLGISAQVNL